MPFDCTPPRPKTHTDDSLLLLRAMKLIERERNWIRGTLKKRRWFGWRYCMVGALVAASRPSFPGEDEAYRFLFKACRAHGTSAVAIFNDHPTTTHALVLQVYREAIDLAMAEQA